MDLIYKDMVKNYLGKIKEYLYEKDILPLIVRGKDLQGSSFEEIQNRMTPSIAYEQSEKFNSLAKWARGESEIVF